METFINWIGYLFSFIFAFGVMSEGVQRKKIRKLGLIGIFIVILGSLLYSIATKSLFIIGLMLDLIFVFLGGVFLLWILFKYILKVSTYK